MDIGIFLLLKLLFFFVKGYFFAKFAELLKRNLVLRSHFIFFAYVVLATTVFTS